MENYIDGIDERWQYERQDRGEVAR